jgi:ferrous iron transport protein A
MIVLNQLPVKGKALIRGFSEGNRELRRKLLALGIVPGSEVEVIRTAFMGDPIEIRLRGFQLCLRKKEASMVLVEQQAR